MTQSRNIVIVFLFGLLFLVYSFLAFKAPEKFTSPDETANFYFTKQFASKLYFKFSEPLEKIAPIVAPRSIMIQKDGLAPGSFLGMPLLYGIISWFLGNWIILFLTPLASVLAVYFFYRLIEIIFDRRIALISAVLMAIHPAFWYYTARGMFHNILFLDLLIICFYFIAKILLLRIKNSAFAKASAGKQELRIKNYADYLLAGLMIGAAIAVRTSEIIWVGASLLALVLIFRKRIDWRMGFWIALLGLIIPMLPILYQNKQLYGNYLTFSYTVGADLSAEVLNKGEKTEAAAGAVDKISESVKFAAKIFDSIAGLFEKAIFPFGIHWNNIFANVWNYGIWLVWPFALLTLFGCIAMFKKIIFKNLILLKDKIFNYSSVRRSSEERVVLIYFIFYLLISAYLILYYGSWELTDNILGGDAVSLEQSYARYWLPIYVFGLPFAAYLLTVIFLRLRQGFGGQAQSVLTGIVVFLIFNFSLAAVLSERNVGLAKIRENTVEYKEVAVKTKRLIESDAVIVSGKADKIFFPEFKVIAQDINTLKKAKQLKSILKKAPVYAAILDFAGQTERLDKLEGYGFKIGKEIKAGEGASLYKITVDK